LQIPTHFNLNDDRASILAEELYIKPQAKSSRHHQGHEDLSQKTQKPSCAIDHFKQPYEESSTVNVFYG
jgi:hypothetical protein